MAALPPPPAYEEVVATAPVPGRYNRLSRQDSLPLEAKQRLLGEITHLRDLTQGQLPWLRNVTSDIDRSYTLLKSNRSSMEREMYEWKVHLTRLIDECYQENMQRVNDDFEAMEHKLVLNREKVYKTYESSRELCSSLEDHVSLRNHHTAQFIKRRLRDKLDEIRAIKRENVVPDQPISSWRFVKPEVTPAQVQELAGKVWQPLLVEEASTDNVSSTVPLLDSRQDNTDSPPSLIPPEDAAATAAPEVTRRQSEAASGESLECGKFTLLHTIQTKTFKDKARCHPISFAVDFDGNIIVADKFNKKLKIFTQRGQLFREIMHPLLHAPTHIALTLAGDIAVSDTESADVKFYSTDGVLLGNVPSLPNAGGLAFNLMGDLLVTDTGRKAVHIVDTQVGVIKSSIDYYSDLSPPHPRYQYFQWPHYVTTGHNDEILVTDRVAGNYQVFTSSGIFMGAVGRCGKGTGEFQDPYGISSYMGHGVIVADYSNNRIQRVDSNGKFLDPILTSEDGLSFPTYASCTTDEKVMVSQYLTGEIKIFSRRSEHLEQDEALPPSYMEVVGEQGPGLEAGLDGLEARHLYGPPPTVGQGIERTGSWETSI